MRYEDKAGTDYDEVFDTEILDVEAERSMADSDMACVEDSHAGEDKVEAIEEAVDKEGNAGIGDEDAAAAEGEEANRDLE